MYYKMIVAYEGTHYYGWQLQPHQRTITQVMQQTFTKLFSQPIALSGASRTDGGVHAIGQVASFVLEKSLAPHKLLYAWNQGLPDDIRITYLEESSSDFHPRRDVYQKEYWYYLCVNPPLPFFTRYGWYVGPHISIEKAKYVLSLFEGTHNFRGFYCADDPRETIRTIDHISIEYVSEYDAYRIIIRARGFLRHMIRRMVGAAVMIAQDRRGSAELVQHMLATGDTHEVAFKAPAHGLFLYKIMYNQQ